LLFKYLPVRISSLALLKANLHLFILLSVLLNVSCATYSSKTRSALEAFHKKQYGVSSAMFKHETLEPSKDQLLALFDYGTSLTLDGDLMKANQVFLEAERLTEYKDYVSLSEEMLSVLTSATTEVYRGEDFEKLMLNAYIALNFLRQGDFEKALVECRKMDQKLYVMKNEGERPWEQIPLARYIPGLVYEATRQWDQAYIAYSKALDLAPKHEPLRWALLRTARADGRQDRVDRHVREWGLSVEDDRVKTLEEMNMGEIILFFENGRAPYKIPHPDFPRIPLFRPSPGKLHKLNLAATHHLGRSREAAEAQADPVIGDHKTFQQRSDPFFSLEDVAIRQSKHKASLVVGKRLTGIVLKETLGRQVEKATDNRALGDLTRLALHVTDRADLRSWRTLPAEYQMVRLRLPPGEWDLWITKNSDSYSAQAKHRELIEEKLKISTGERKFLLWRYHARDL
jgi:hypothetical protein